MLVVMLRAAGAASPSRTPQPRQNFRSAGLARPHRGHGRSETMGVPQPPQKTASSGFAAPHVGQFMVRECTVSNSAQEDVAGAVDLSARPGEDAAR